VVCVEILTKLWGPLGLELLGLSGNSNAIDLDVDLRDVSLSL
jgi:hypothetical protein